MYKWLFFIFILTIGAVFYHYPGLYDILTERVPIWLGIKQHEMLYRWEDEQGVIRVGPTPPKDRSYEVIQIRHDEKNVQKAPGK